MDQNNLNLLFRLDEPMQFVAELRDLTAEGSEGWRIVARHCEACLKELEAFNEPKPKADQ
jgi:hypothetical protein